MSRGVGWKWVQEGSDLGGLWGRWQTITGGRCCNWQWEVWRGGLSVWPHCMMSSVVVNSCWTSVNICEHKVMAGTWGWKQTVGLERMRVCVGVWVGERERGECVSVHECVYGILIWEKRTDGEICAHALSHTHHSRTHVTTYMNTHSNHFLTDFRERNKRETITGDL